VQCQQKKQQLFSSCEKSRLEMLNIWNVECRMSKDELRNALIRQAQVTKKDTCGSGLPPRIKMIAAASRSHKPNTLVLFRLLENIIIRRSAATSAIRH
jgi:hypothetical protein